MHRFFLRTPAAKARAAAQEEAAAAKKAAAEKAAAAKEEGTICDVFSTQRLHSMVTNRDV